MTLRTALADAFDRRNVLFVLSYVAGGIERLLWNVGDRRTAALLGRYARGNLTSWTPPSVVDTDAFRPEELDSIDSEVATLDFDAACVIALAALDRIIDSD